jgi:ABC-2 type transporter
MAESEEVPDGADHYSSGNDIQRELYHRETHESASPASMLRVERTYPISLLEQTRLNIWRELVMRKRDKATVRARVIKKVVLAFVAGSLFFQLPHEQSGLATRQSLLFFSLLFLSFSNIGSIVAFYRERAVFYRQREAKYYAPSAYLVSFSSLRPFNTTSI